MLARRYTKVDKILEPTTQTDAWTSPQQFNNGWTGLRIDIDITALGGTNPTVTYTVESFDPAKNGWVTEIASTALNAAGHYLLHIHPHMTAVANQVRQAVLPHRWRIRTTLGGTSPTVTHSISATYVE